MDSQRIASPPAISRRHVLGGGAAIGLSLLSDPARRLSVIEAAKRVRPAGGDLGAVEHVIFLMLENRSFDHYFGSYRGVRGFDDHGANDAGIFAQPDGANTSRPPLGVQLPFHLDTTTGVGESTRDIRHDWITQHQSWNKGAMDSFVRAHSSALNDGPVNGLMTMGYYTRADLPFHYALADAFTICDHYFCSVMGPTDPNRLMALSGSIDPAGTHGGPVLTTSSSPDTLFSAHWTAVPQLLENAGVSWKSYTAPGQGYLPSAPGAGSGDAILQYFSAFRKPTSPLFKRAFLPKYPADFVHDVRTGTLPKVSWITPPNGYDEHPPSPPRYGAWLISQVLSTLVANPRVWAKTVLFVTYDENGGFFDHVAPPVAPPSTAGEYVTRRPLPSTAGGAAGPIGLGFRVPMIVVSPFSRGGYLSSDVFDHTSQIRFLETRFGIRSPEISRWRRLTTGDLTATLRLSKPALGRPPLPATTSYRSAATPTQGCTAGDVSGASVGLPVCPLPAQQVMPVQESGALHSLPR